MNSTDPHKELRRLRNAATAILVGLDGLEQVFKAATPAPEVKQPKRKAGKYQEQFVNVRPGGWKKPEHLKKKK